MASAKTKEQPSLSIVRKLGAGPAKVWRAITEPEMLKQWMARARIQGPGGGGRRARRGRYHIVNDAPDGEVHDVSGVYREIVPNKKLVYTWAWEEHAGAAVGRDDRVARRGQRHRADAQARAVRGRPMRATTISRAGWAASHGWKRPSPDGE